MAAPAVVVCADTSFLFSLYARDRHTAQARAALAGLSTPVVLSPFNEYELANAVRLAAFRRLFTAADVATVLGAFAADLSSGRLTLPPCDLAPVLAQARRLSAAHTLTGGHRAFDVLHVAAALHLSAGEFLSFDANQRVLAAAEGLTVGP